LLSPERTAVGAGLLVAFFAALFLLWRYRLQKKVAREMEERIQERTSELRRSEEVFRKVYEHMAVGVARVSRNFRIEAANEAYCHMLGYREEELIGKHLSDITHPEILEENLRKQSQLTQGDIDHYRLEKKFIHKSGHVVHGILDANLVRDEAGQPSFFLGSVLDITERKKAEEAILESERRYRRLVDNSTEAVFLCDYSGRIIDANRVASRRLGYLFQDLLSLKAWDVDIGVSPERWFDIWSKSRPEDPKTFQGVHRCRDGSTYPVEVTATLFEEEHKAYILANVRDITERKRAEEEQENLQFQLLQAQKMESVGRLAGGVAHDLNNMLVAILGYGDLLMADTGLAERHRKRVELMHQAGLRSRDLVKQLLAFSRKQTLHMENLNLNQVLSGFTSLLEKTLRENIVIQYRLSDQLPLAMADRGQLEQVILNLAVNAQDAMPEGGTLTLETSVVELDEGYASQHLGVIPGRYVMLVVSDTGQGMDKATQEYIFDPFFTTKDVGEGTGLGLATVYGIVKQHQGNIWVYSELGQGTTFKIYLPTTEQVQGDVEQAEAADGHPASHGREAVLVVEDDDMVRELAVNVLEEQGYRVLSAASGLDCLDLLDHHEHTFDLMLTDVIMPDMNGKTLFEAVAHRQPDIRVLYMSGYTENVISHHGVLDEGVDFLQKPFSVQELCLKVRNALDG
jgi:PAS domain S-box-containing protein